MILLREKKQIAIYILALAIVVGFVLLRYLPLRKKIKAVRQDLALQRSAIAKALAESQEMIKVKGQMLKLQKVAENYERKIPGHRALGELLQRVAGLMNEHNLKEQVIDPGSEIETSGLKCIPVNMRCRGSLAQIFEFYKSLQRLDRLARIECVKFVNESDFSGQVSMETEAVVYYRPQTDEAAGRRLSGSG